MKVLHSKSMQLVKYKLKPFENMYGWMHLYMDTLPVYITQHFSNSYLWLQVFGLRSSVSPLLPGLPGHCNCSSWCRGACRKLQGFTKSTLDVPIVGQCAVDASFGTNSQGFWSLVQKNGTRSVPQTVPERKGVPETTHSGTHSGDKYVVFAIPPVAANFFYRRVWTFIVHELSSKWVKKGFCAG